MSCSICGKMVVWPDTHKCPPRFVVWCPYDGETEDEGREIYAYDHKEAAEEWARLDDRASAEYRIVGGSDIEVCVRQKGENDVLQFVVSGEAQPVYHARPVKP